ncbi:putative zinc transporter msc2, partial [Serendipita sp. 405]
MQRAMESLGQGSKTPDEKMRQRRQSNSMIPVPKLNITSGSRPGTALSMASRSGSPLQPGDMQKNPKESPSAWKRLSVPQDSPSNPFKDTPGGRAGARSQTPESMLRARTMQIPLYLENTSPGTSGGSPSSPHLTPGSKVRNAPSSYKGDGRTLVSSPGSNSAGGDGNAGRPPSRSISRLNSYGFGRMTPSLETPNHVYVPAKTDELDVEVAKIVNGMAHGFLFERVDPPRKAPARAGEEIKAQYAISNALNRKVITCRLVIISRGGTENKKVMCRVGGGWLELPMYILNHTIPPELAIKTLVADILLPLSLCSAKYWLLVRGVGSLWLSINVLAGGGIGALAYLAIRGRVAVRGDLPWKLLLSVGGLVFAQQIALFYSLKRLDSSRIVFIAPFCYALIQQVVKTHSVRYIIGLTLAVIVAAMVDSKLATENGTATFKAYIALLFYGSLQVVSTTASAHLANSFETVEVTKALTVLSAAALTIPIHLLGRTIGLLPPYPYVPLLALTPLPLLAFVLLFYYPHIITSGLAYSPRSVFQLAYIPTAVMTCILSPLFSRQIAISDAPLAILLFYAQRPSSNLGPGGTRMQKSASEPFLRLLQGYINTILSNPESRKIFYFLIVNLAYMFVQLLYGVWTNSLGLISDAIHMAFDCMAIAMGLFASVMATWKPNERFTYGYSRIETLSGFANGIFLVLISVFIIVEAIQRLIDPPEMNTRQLLLVSTVGLGVNLFG